MVDAKIKHQIERHLDRLPTELQQRVLDFAEALALSVPRGVPGSQLLRFADILDADEAKAMSEAIEAGCEQVDADAW